MPDPMIPIRSIATAVPLSLVTGGPGERKTLPPGREWRPQSVRIATIGAPTSVPCMSRRRTLIVEGERRFPAAVEDELQRRRAEALASVSGRVLDLSDPLDRIVLRDAIDVGPDPQHDQWDAVVSIAELVRFPDLAAAIDAVDAILAPGGRFLALEPVTRPGTIRVLAQAPWSASRWVRGFHVGRDPMPALRATSLVNDDIDRFTMPTFVAPLRHFLSVGARRVVTVPEVHP